MRLFVKNNMTPDDTLMLTVAVRNIKRSHPDIHTKWYFMKEG